MIGGELMGLDAASSPLRAGHANGYRGRVSARREIAFALLGALAAAALVSVPATAFVRTEDRAACADHSPLRHPYFGDLHVHTALSLDASTQGTRNLPADAYRFAQGAPLDIQPYDADGRAQRRLRLDRPLDFMAVTDHAELFGELEICTTPGLPGYGSAVCRLYRWWPRLAFFVMNSRATGSGAAGRFRFCGEDGRDCLEVARTPWQLTRQAAEDAYDRSPACRFTTFVGYEWTGSPGTRNLHRNVIFRNAAVPELPVSYLDEPEPEGLWRRLNQVCDASIATCEWLSIPHNSNLSGGLMFAPFGEDGRPLSAAQARLRARAEPLVEVLQHKGDSECILGADTRDELCAFEKLPYDDFASAFVGALARKPDAAGFVRDALKQGLRIEQEVGENPFAFGLVASTDTHLGAAGYVDETDHPGHGGAGMTAAGELPPGLPDDIEFNPGGLAVLWAEENSRDALFEAMRRREAYGTSGPRMIVRFFGGWDFPADLCAAGDVAAAGYRAGVPMGGNLPPRQAPIETPIFVVSALRDSGTAERAGTPLQRIQIIKGWARDGEVFEEVYEVAGDPGNGAGVDPSTCAPHGEGFDRLCAVWRDPDFDPAVPAFYYTRVLENPVCRWSAHLCLAAGVDCDDRRTVGRGFEACCDERYPRVIQERAWTSPIWFAAEGG